MEHNELLKFRIWKTIKLGTGFKTSSDFQKALKDRNYRITYWGNNILTNSNFTVSDTEREIDLVNVSIEELGLSREKLTKKIIYNRALELGLELCPAEVGPQLRLQYPNQPKNEMLIAAMKLITISGIFGIGSDNSNLWLFANFGAYDNIQVDIHRWLFVQSR